MGRPQDLPRPPCANFDTIDPNIKPMFQDSFNVGVEYQVNPTTVVGVNYVHNYLKRTIEDIGALVNGDEVYVIGNPGEGLAIHRCRRRGLTAASPRRSRSGSTMRSS